MQLSQDNLANRYLEAASQYCTTVCTLTVSSMITSHWSQKMLVFFNTFSSLYHFLVKSITWLMSPSRARRVAAASTAITSPGSIVTSSWKHWVLLIQSIRIFAQIIPALGSHLVETSQCCVQGIQGDAGIIWKRRNQMKSKIIVGNSVATDCGYLLLWR